MTAIAPRPLVRRPENAPDFLCAGAQKGGSRWLYDQLQLHPGFFMPPVKELHYLDRRGVRAEGEKLIGLIKADLPGTNANRVRHQLRPIDQRDIDFLHGYVRLPRWRLDLEAYAALFSVKGTALSGDVTPDYSKLDERTIRRVVARFPAVRVIFIARDPVERLWSHVCMHVRKGDISGRLDETAIAGLLRQDFIASRTYQTEIVARWRRFVPPERFGLFLFDDLLSDPTGLRRRVLTFLGGDPELPSGTLPAGFNRKVNNEKLPLSDQLRGHIARLLTDELSASARAFGGAATGWPARYGL